MNFSARTEYGVRLMVFLGAREEDSTPTSLKAIAEAERLPLPFLEHVVADLKRSGLVVATRGPHGGYHLGRAAEEISMDEVVQALEGTIAPMECLVARPSERVSCSHELDLGRTCATRLMWLRVQGGVLQALRATTLAELVEFSAAHAPAAAA
jgi:Rrf2 family transcriptional regulator, cysteine metabolism repressor